MKGNFNSLKLATTLIILIIFTAGCQPTPDEPVVVYARDLQEKIERSNASIEAYEAPEHWTETLDLKGSNAKIEIDADVIVPDVTAFPVYKVEKAMFTETKLKPLLDYFIPDKSNVFKQTDRTKEEYEEELVRARKEGNEEWAKDLEELIQTAPESVEREYITDWTINSKEDNVYGLIKMDNGLNAAVGVKYDSFAYGEGNVYTNDILGYDGKATVEEVGISEADAIAAAQAVFGDLGIKDMVVYKMQKAKLYAATPGGFSIRGDDPESLGYMITFVPSIGGIPAREINGGVFSYRDEFAYTAPFFPEKLDVYINEDGQLQYFVWDNVLDKTGEVTENASLLPFEEVKERIRDLLTYIYSYDKSPITVELIEMRTTLVNVKDEPGKAMYVPAWYVDGTIKYSSLIEDGEGGWKDYDEQRLTLNAIDGGRILDFPPTPDMLQAAEEMRANES